MTRFLTLLLALTIIAAIGITVTMTGTTTAATTATAPTTSAAKSVAGVPSLEKVMAPRVLGDPKAPVTITEFASLTCSHCADFHTKVMPELQKQAIDTGKAKLVFRDFPLDGIALRASALARCLPHERYFPFIKILFERQKTWAVEKDPTAALVKLATLAGLSPDVAQACMTDMKILEAIANDRGEAGEKYKIQATPTFIFNDDAAKISGAKPLTEYLQTIERVSKGEKITQEPAPTAAPDTDNHDNHNH